MRKTTKSIGTDLRRVPHKQKTAGKLPESHAASRKHKAPTDTKAAALLDLLRRRDGASLDEMQKISGWQPHSVRGFLSGTVKKTAGTEAPVIEDEGWRAPLHDCELASWRGARRSISRKRSLT